jgi:hypothetical protein
MDHDYTIKRIMGPNPFAHESNPSIMTLFGVYEAAAAIMLPPYAIMTSVLGSRHKAIAKILFDFLCFKNWSA